VLAVAKKSGNLDPKMLAEVEALHAQPRRLVEGERPRRGFPREPSAASNQR
jgi:hypothetical protein